MSVTCDRLLVFSDYSTNKTDHQDITEILLKVALSTINQTNFIQKYWISVRSSIKLKKKNRNFYLFTESYFFPETQYLVVIQYSKSIGWMFALCHFHWFFSCWYIVVNSFTGGGSQKKKDHTIFWSANFRIQELVLEGFVIT